MNTEPPLLNKTLPKESEAKIDSGTTNALMPGDTAAPAIDPAIQSAPIKPRLSFWETAYYWIMARS